MDNIEHFNNNNKNNNKNIYIHVYILTEGKNFKTFLKKNYAIVSVWHC